MESSGRSGYAAVVTVLRFFANGITTPTIVLVALLLLSDSQFHAERTDDAQGLGP